ncbi:MAG TPA: lipid-A-disaccharide synthase [Thermoanaerobaculia bacterium]|nr:lipid-A-disaccharide synthase [Thermoanaerobaculia bacterium]
MKLYVVAGEASGDLHAAEVARELRLREPGIQFLGIGGERLVREGLKTAHDFEKLGVVGLFNVIRHLPMFRRLFRAVVREIEREKPDAVLLVDYPGFNLRLARKCKELGIKVIYYISPQVWAWKQSRVRDIARFVDLMIVIFPFEKDFYERHGVKAEYLGHPLVEQLADVRRIGTNQPSHPLRIALMPGSRRLEIETLLPEMLRAAEILSARRTVRAFLIRAETIGRDQLEPILSRSTVPIEVKEGRAALRDSDLCLCSSGTATLEAAVIGVPTIVLYRLSRLTYMLARRLVHLPFFSLINIVGEGEIAPELLQSQVTGEEIARRAEEMLEPARYAEILAQLAEVRSRLGEAGASGRAAERILAFTGASSSSR